MQFQPEQDVFIQQLQSFSIVQGQFTNKNLHTHKIALLVLFKVQKQAFRQDPYILSRVYWLNKNPNKMRQLASNTKNEINLQHIRLTNPLSFFVHLSNNTNVNIALDNNPNIRLAEIFAQTNAHIYSNQRTSSINGLIATVIEIAKNNSCLTFLLISDTAFLYKINSLVLLSQLQSSFTLILLIYNRASIFKFLLLSDNQHRYQGLFSRNENSKTTLIGVFTANQLHHYCKQSRS